MKHKLFVLFLGVLIYTDFSHAQTNLFRPYVSFATGSSPEAVAIGDVNGDGRNDVVMTTSYSSDPGNAYQLFVFLQNASGGLDPPIKYPGGNGLSVDIGDFNNDGRMDIAVSSSNAIGVYLQNSSGGLHSMVSYPTNHSSFSNVYKLRVGDFNHDGLSDIVTIDWGTQSVDVDVFLQNTGGTLNPPVTYTVVHGGYDDLEVGDVNNDGLTDIIVMSGQGFSPNLGVLLQKTDKTFGDPVYYDLGGNELTHGVAVGDVNGDSLEDVVVSYGGNWPSSKIGIFLQNNSGTLDPGINIDSFDIPGAVTIADVNQDGKKDILVIHGGFGVYLQKANGNLMPEELYPSPSSGGFNPHKLTVGDINGDGLNDVVIAGDGLVVHYHRGLESKILASPSSIDFASIYVGNSSTRSITISNEGLSELTIGTVTLCGTGISEFQIKTDTCSEKTLVTASTCTIEVKFAPSSPGMKTAGVAILSNDPNTPLLNLQFFSCATYPSRFLFSPYITIPTGSSPEAVAIGDVNGDGRNDVVMTTSSYFDPENDYKLFVFLQNASGSLDPPIKYPGGNGNSVGIGDFNHDGRLDIIVSASNAIGVYLQNSSGGLHSMVSYPTNHSSFSNVYKLRVGDFNHDGLLDIVSIDWGTQSFDVDVFLQNTSGTLNPPVTYTVTHDGWDDLEVGDVNNDGLQDIIVMSGQSYAYPNIGILLQQPNGAFAAPVYYDLGWDENTGSVAVGDVNGDSLQDVVVTYGGNKIGIFSQNNGRTLDPVINIESYNSPGPIEIADVNQDGKKDIIAVHGGWMALGIYRQDFYCSLAPEELYPNTYSGGYNPHRLAVGDINVDGVNDIVIADNGLGLVVFYGIKNLVTEYYLDVLDRQPEPGGAEWWRSEVDRIVYIGIDIMEGFEGLAKFFFDSEEYQLKGKDDPFFVTDLYETFLQRTPDQWEVDFWIGQLNQGLTRDMLITQFAYSEEFKLYMENLFGSGVTRPENNLVNDLYRGFLNRFPDTGGFNGWLGMMKNAQCVGPQAVKDLTNQIALGFVQSTEYGLRNRNNQEYVEDLYNGILRRGADPAGFAYWVDLLNKGTYNREQLLPFFTDSAEFQLRVQEVIDAGCMP